MGACGEPWPQQERERERESKKRERGAGIAGREHAHARRRMRAARACRWSAAARAVRECLKCLSRGSPHGPRYGPDRRTGLITGGERRRAAAGGGGRRGTQSRLLGVAFLCKRHPVRVESVVCVCVCVCVWARRARARAPVAMAPTDMSASSCTVEFFALSTWRKACINWSAHGTAAGPSFWVITWRVPHSKPCNSICASRSSCGQGAGGGAGWEVRAGSGTEGESRS